MEPSETGNNAIQPQSQGELPGQEAHICPICSKVFSTWGTMQRHALIHGDYLFWCSMEGCGKGFTRKDHLRRHLQTLKHEQERCQEAKDKQPIKQEGH